jgi:predicted TIM-barrel fold metal-dependent hydrolase
MPRREIENLITLDYNAGMLIDFHTHIFPPLMIQDRERLCRQDRFFAHLYAKPTAKLANAEDLLRSMDEHGVERAVIASINWINGDLCRQANDYILDCLSRYPERLHGLCGVPCSGAEPAVQEIQRCLASGAAGAGEIRLDWLKGDACEEALDAAARVLLDTDRLLMLHSSEPVGHVYTGKGSATPKALMRFILAYPDLRIICAHLGGGLPFYAYMPEVSEALKHVYFDTAAIPFLYKPAILKGIIDAAGSSKLLFGSDYPLMQHGRILQYIRTSQLDENDLEGLLGRNAEALLRL